MGKKKSDSNQITASNRSKESQCEMIEAGLAPELSVRTVERHSLSLSNAFS